jgi:phosphoglycolate phosphatase-like HAD superfamily hydrolase
VFALEAATEEVCGAPVDLQAMKTAGLTDSEIATVVLEAHRGERPAIGDVARFLAAYEAALPACLPRRRGRVLPGVRDVLESLAGRDDVRSLLLTGNTEAGARAKLAHYGLDGLIADGAFCRPGDDRAAIARRARALLDGVGEDRLLVIGDTPADVSCARAIGVRCLAVATGTYSAAELRAAGAWRVVDELPAPVEFARLAGLAIRCVDTH